ncbi:MAG: TldD/PmbA family protein, partial [Synergistaceae bacterium]|nr:TldD/PmbA family protein [Synergistaceae bacterium]
FDEGMESFADADFRMNTCLLMNETARSRDERVASVRSSEWSHDLVEMFYASTAGLSFWKRGTTASCGVSVVLNDGETFETGAYGRIGRFTEDLDVEETARKAVDRTLMVLGGRSLPTGKYTLLLDPEVSASLAGEIGDMFCASEVHKGRSLMAGKLGHRVAGSVFSLTDDSRIKRGMGSSSCDLEGVPSGRTVLIANGVANAYLYNLQYAARDGTKSTGSASRGLSSLPDVGTSNLVLEPGRETPKTLMERVRRGFLVLELMGLHTINSVTGDFSLGARGVYIENGEPRGPVSGVTIADNLIGFLEKITSVGNDLVFYGSIGAATIVVEDVTLAGE